MTGRGAVDWDDVNALTNSLVYRIPVDDKAKQDIKAFVAKKYDALCEGISPVISIALLW